jgi:prolyl-tRNA synthetase
LRPLASGLYMLLPLGHRVMRKLEAIVDDELQRIKCQRLDMPNIHPKSLWEVSGRWNPDSSELFRLLDNKGVSYCLAPTHEEPFTMVVADHVSSHKQLPLRLYQIGKKYRDELRPRGGLLRAREFVMKDLYTFDKTEEEAMETYELVASAYEKIFRRMGLSVVKAQADAGNIGGSTTHEFHVIAPSGKDLVLKCNRQGCEYAANVEVAVAGYNDRPPQLASNALPAAAAAYEPAADGSSELLLCLFAVSSCC